MTGMKSGRTFKALAVSLALGLGITACSRDFTTAYVYATSATRGQNGVVNAYAVDYQTGALDQLADSPITLNGRNPVTLLASPDGKNIYVVDRDSSQVEQLAVGSDGKLYNQHSYSVVSGSGSLGSFPTAAAISPDGKFLYVTFTYQNGFTVARPGPGGLAIFPVSADGTLGTALTNTTIGATGGALPYVPLGANPSGVAVSADNARVYTIEQDTASINGNSSPAGYLLAFTKNADGSLTPIAGTAALPTSTGSALTGSRVGSKPSAIAVGLTSRFVYVTDQSTNQLYDFQVVPVIQAVPSSPYSTGSYPLGLKIDPRNKFLYTANFADSTVSIFTINGDGTLSASGGGSAAASTGPTCVTIEPSRGLYLYASNQTDGTISASQLDPGSGALRNVQGTPYQAQPLPSCVVAIANGAHPTQLQTP